jgi:hypothetical protein
MDRSGRRHTGSAASVIAAVDLLVCRVAWVVSRVHVPGSSESTEKKRIDRITAVVAVASLALSIVALVVSYSAIREEAAVDLEAAASVNSLGSTPAGYAIRISFINQSLRPVIIRSIDLKVGGVPVASVESVLFDGRAGTDAAALGDEPLEDNRPLPLTLAERGAETLVGLANFSTVDRQASAREHTDNLSAARAFCDELPPDPSRRLAPRFENETVGSSVELEVDVEPGGSFSVPVTINRAIGADNPWRMEVTGPRARPTGLAFWRFTSAPSASRLLTAEIWRGDGTPVSTASLPVSGSATSEVSFQGLRSGYYRAALLQQGNVLAVGHFDVPLGEARESIYPLGAQRANGQCELIEGKKNVFTYRRRGYE